MENIINTYLKQFIRCLILMFSLSKVMKVHFFLEILQYLTINEMREKCAGMVNDPY